MLSVAAPRGLENTSSKTGRRHFLRGSTAIAVTALLGKAAWAFEPRSEDTARDSPIRLGVASYSFRKFGRQDVIKFVKELNTPYLNVKDVHLPMTTPEEIRQDASEYTAAGIKLTAAGTIYFTEDDDDDMRRKFEYCKLAGIPVMVAGPTPQTLPRLERFVKEYDIKIAIHNHGPEDQYFPSPLDALKLVKNMDPRMGVCIDVGHATRAGTDVPKAIREAGPRLYDVHMKDLANSTSKESQVAVGDGSLPVEQIFAALIAIRYAGYVDLEYEINEDNPMPGMIKSFAYMRGVLAGMGYKA
jgi:sugar phosphate isomerase/epimerase